jgi:hypothetical protein
MNDDMKQIHYILRHIRHVQDNCLLLGERLIDRGEFHLGRELIANSLLHDYSKFFGQEFIALRPDNHDKSQLAFAVKQHNETNYHHPERWGNISKMPDIYLAEFVCDIKARSGEFGTSLVDWINKVATSRFGFTIDDPVHERIMRFVNLLLDESFKPLPK